ncbi:MAG: Oxygen regulatory protein NreC [Planctomycetota bacterium]|jgi:DNA-binding NarL/FixJ family response regulator
MYRARVLIVDDHPMVRLGLSMSISADPDFEVCGEAGSESEALELLRKISPDLMIVDVSLKEGNGIELIKQIRGRYPRLPILVVSGFKESLYGERALRAGASGYLNKQESQAKLIEALRMILKGGRYVSPELLGRLVGQALDHSETDGERSGDGVMRILSDRELEIFRMIGLGMTSGAIANELHLSRHTIDTHRENIKRKTGAKNAGELSRQAVQWLLENG